jgi:hypothetical protein
MINEALEYLQLGKSRSNGHRQTAGRPFVTGNDIQQMAKPAEHFIRQYPAAALAAAFVVGVAIAWWIKRK